MGRHRLHDFEGYLLEARLTCINTYMTTFTILMNRRLVVIPISFYFQPA